MIRAGTVFRLVCLVLLINALAACYGTKVPPPESSPSGPPGLSRATPSDLFIPDELPALLAVYRQWLFDKNSHISRQLAQDYADAEVERIKEQYAGHEQALKFAIKQRLQVRPANPQEQKQAEEFRGHAYPSDLKQEN